MAEWDHYNWQEQPGVPTMAMYDLTEGPSEVVFDQGQIQKGWLRQHMAIDQCVVTCLLHELCDSALKYFFKASPKQIHLWCVFIFMCVYMRFQLVLILRTVRSLLSVSWSCQLGRSQLWSVPAAMCCWKMERVLLSVHQPIYTYSMSLTTGSVVSRVSHLLPQGDGLVIAAECTLICSDGEWLSVVQCKCEGNQNALL